MLKKAQELKNKAKQSANNAKNKINNKVVEVNNTVAKAKDVVASIVEEKPPPRENWTYNLCTSCGEEFEFGCYSCFCPCFALERNAMYLATGEPPENKPTNYWIAACAFMCIMDSATTLRGKIRERANMAPDECCTVHCLDTCCVTLWCFPCAQAQEKLELRAWYGHGDLPKNEEGVVPIHKGSPAYRKSIMVGGPETGNAKR